jgi:hypothetical protein
MRIVAERRRSVLRAEVTARPEAVLVHARLDDREAMDRVYHAARRTDADLLAEAIESGGRDPIATAAIAMAAALAGPETAESAAQQATDRAAEQAPEQAVG